MVLPSDRRVVTISGDGGFLMNVQELETAKRLGLAIVNIVWSDSAFGVIEVHQRRKFGHLAGTKFTNPDLVRLAESFGIAGMRVSSADELHADAQARARAGHTVGRRDPDRLPREPQVLDESGRPGEGRRGGLTTWR